MSKVPPHGHTKYATDDWLRRTRAALQEADAALDARVTALEAAEPVPGPQGEPGPAGPEGLPGPKGDPGAVFADGVARPLYVWDDGSVRVRPETDTEPETEPEPGRYPPDRTSLPVVATPSFPKPAYLVPFTDPVWGTRVMRITDVAFRRHIYSSNQPWNCDGSLLMMAGGSGSERRILDGVTYADLGSAGPPSTGRWSHTEPHRMYGTSSGGNANAFVSRDYPSWSDTVLYRWSHESSVSLGSGEGVPSVDDRYWSIVGASGGVYVFDRVNGTSSAAITMSSVIDNTTISPLGTYLLVMYNGSGTGSTVGTWIRDRATGAVVRQMSTQSLHGDIGIDADGREVFVMSTGSNVRCFDLADGSRDRDLFPPGYAFGACHVSCRNEKQPGWAIVSVYATQAGKPGNDTVVAVKMDGSGTMRVFAHIHNTWSSQGSDHYKSEPQATVSPDGSKALYASEWTDGGDINAYVAGMAL